MIVIIRPELNTALLKWAWAVRADEQMRFIHNFMGEWHTSFKLQFQWNQLPERIKAIFPYQLRLEKIDWIKFVILHRRITKKLHEIIHENRPAIPIVDINDMSYIMSLADEYRIAREDNTMPFDFDTDFDRVEED